VTNDRSIVASKRPRSASFGRWMSSIDRSTRRCPKNRSSIWRHVTSCARIATRA
jgi:hypothetical protein